MLLWKDLLTPSEKSKVQGARNRQKRKVSLHILFVPAQPLSLPFFLEMPIPPQKLTDGPL